ncbi:MAG: ATP-binding protein [Bacilli bacterium]|nr:ATP-binding protein [Bacilli bacterium]
MSRTNIIAREEECRKLSRALNEEEAQLVVVTGRRRVGKTFLINEYFDNGFDFKITGAHKESKTKQLNYFRLELLRRTEKDVGEIKDWPMAFFYLQQYLSSLSREKKAIVFFDEMPWLDTHKSGFLKAFEHFWNDFGSALHNLVFIIAGSATSWITEKILHNKGGLYKRKTLELGLLPFTLEETERYFVSRGIRYSRYHIAVIYMCVGGIPYYLRMFDNALDPLRNIDALFFGRKAALKGEFKDLFETLFKKDSSYVKIVEFLSTKRKGYSFDDIANHIGLVANGGVSEMLNNLIDAGIVRKNAHYLERKTELYQLCDFFSLFYLRFVQGKPSAQKDYFSKTFLTSSTAAWEGFSFELLCRTHLDAIRFSLGIYAMDYQSYGFDSKADEENSGAQVDLVIERKDKVLHLCEMKFSRYEFEIDSDYMKDLENKMNALSSRIGKLSSVQLTFITVAGLKQNSNSNYVNQVLTIDHLFVRTPGQ